MPDHGVAHPPRPKSFNGAAARELRMQGGTTSGHSSVTGFNGAAARELRMLVMIIGSDRDHSLQWGRSS